LKRYYIQQGRKGKKIKGEKSNSRGEGGKKSELGGEKIKGEKK